MSDDTNHIYNSTYPHVEDMTYAIENLKVSQCKSALKIAHSLFDKIAYLISGFFNLNELKDESRISIDSLFIDFNDKESRNEWKPHKKLKDNNNHFTHALFYILKDIRDVQNSTSVS